MSTERSQNLKKVLDAVPAGYLVDASWLTTHGIAYESFRDYVKRGWLERLARGVFRRPVLDGPHAAAIDWKSAVLSLQHIMEYPVHVGGLTALSLQGYGHYVPLGRHSAVWLYGSKIPNWLAKLPLNTRLETRSTSLFNAALIGLVQHEESTSGTLPWHWPLKMSAPERAILEVLDELPMQASFHNVDMVFESLTTLRPTLLSTLLQSCRKIKVTRLFFVFADRHNHPWRKRLDPDEFNLGTGDRALAKGGKIHPRYRIMVPTDFVHTEASDGP